jgi:dihydrofolate reductase
MSKVVAIMSMSLDGYIADLNDGVAEVFDWYFASGDVEFHTGGSDPMTFRVSGPSAEHLRGLWSELGAVLTGRRTFDVAHGWDGNHAMGTSIRTYPPHPRRMAATQLDCAIRDRRNRKRGAPSQSRRRREVRWGPRR